MGIYITILEQGLIYGILALGVYITYKILDFPDLTVDGSFPLGAALTATMITKGVNPYLTLPASFLIGVLAGICTGLIHVKCKVRDLLSGIIMMTALWTINLRPWSSCSIAVCQSRTFPPRMSLPRQNLLLHLYPLCRDSPVNMQMFCPMAQESSQLHTMKITLLSGVADPDVQRYFSVFCIKFLSGILCLIPV